MTNQLCSDLDGQSLALGVKVQESTELTALQEISSVTKRIFDDMCKIQEESWAVGVLLAVPSKSESAAEENLPTDTAVKQSHATVKQSHRGSVKQQTTVAAPEPAAEPSAAPKASERSGNLPNGAPGAFNVGDKVEGLPDLAELLARGGDDGFSEAYVARVQAAFKRFQVPDSADCHVGDLCGLLQYLGHLIAKEETILPLIREVTTYDYLDIDEFLRFMERYLPWEREQYHEVFRSFDEDGSGSISIVELKALLNHLGFIPIRSMIREALLTVDSDQNGTLDFEELVLFLAVYRRAEGFMRSEVAELRRIFNRFSKQSGGTPGKLLTAECLSDALVQVFGLHVSETTEKLSEQLKNGQGLQKSSLASVADSGKSECLTFAEFLIFARKTREATLENLKGTYKGLVVQSQGNQGAAVVGGGAREQADEFRKADEDGDGTVSDWELRKALQSIGYTPLQEVIDQVLEDVNNKQDRNLDFNDFFDFMLIYRQREGFKREEVQEMKQLFERFDGDDSGEVSAMELNELFRHLGYRVTMDQVHLFVAQVDENQSNCLDFREYLKLMQLHREAELKKIANAFAEHKDAATNTVPTSQLPRVLKDLSHEPPKGALKQYNGSKGLDFDALVGLVDLCRADLVARERKKAGFTDTRIAELREAYNKYDKDKSGEIDTKELLDILTQFGWNPKTQKEQQELMKKLQTAKDRAKEAGAESAPTEGVIDFWTFVQLSRMLETEKEEQEEELMGRLMKELNFTQKEVDDFRQIYMNKKHEIAEEVKTTAGEEPEGLPRDDVRRLVRSLGISLIGENKAKLEAKLKELGCTERQPLDFPGFLQLMRWLMSDLAAN
mmetsp:Transcript_127731/g.355458  ORF Transcript_127731/g.355458 Transcript_127731/m.355458 type:complete len:842 (-) Transcript_127731:212-2737(-)